MFKRIFNSKTAKKFIIGLGVVIVLTAAAITIKDEIEYQLYSGGYGDESAAGQPAGGCSEGGNVALIKIHGSVVTYKIDPADDPNGTYDPDSVSSEDVLRNLEEIENNNEIKGIIVEIDSLGGSPVAAEEIMNRLLGQNLPVAAFIRDVGYSAGYLVATAADRIYASPMSDVGSIGVTMSYLDNSKKNIDDGLTYNQLSTGKFKDMGDPDKALTPEEKAIFMADLEKTHWLFVKYVAKNRNLDIEAVKKLADGSSLIAQDAIDAGLIDAIGGLKQAKMYLQGKIGEEVAVCSY